jgi:uroporphyrinogen decarboxylase
VLKYNPALINKWIEIGVGMMAFGDDLGLQKNLPISPANWRHYLKPGFQKMYQRCKTTDIITSQHTDGYILDMIPDLIGSGLDILNPQVRPNALQGLKKYCLKKVAVRLDLDRQLFPFATGEMIREHIKEAVDTLSLPDGGLMLLAECEPDVPLENIETICETLEELGCRAG